MYRHPDHHANSVDPTPLPEGRYPVVGDIVLYKPYWFNTDKAREDSKRLDETALSGDRPRISLVDQLRPAIVTRVRSGSDGIPYVCLKAFLDPMADSRLILAKRLVEEGRTLKEEDMFDLMEIYLACHGLGFDQWRFRDHNYDANDSK